MLSENLLIARRDHHAQLACREEAYMHHVLRITGDAASYVYTKALQMVPFAVRCYVPLGGQFLPNSTTTQRTALRQTRRWGGQASHHQYELP